MNRRFVSSLILVAVGIMSASALANPPHKAHPGRGPHAGKRDVVGPSAEPKPLPIGIRRVDVPDTARPQPTPQPAPSPGGKLKRPTRPGVLKPRPAR